LPILKLIMLLCPLEIYSMKFTGSQLVWLFKKAAIAVGIILILLLLFWPTSKQNMDGKIHLRYWYATGQKEEIPYHVKLFNQTHDSIVVKAVPIPWQESEKKVLTAVLSGNPPDIVDQFVPVVKWASRLALIPLDSFIIKDHFDTSVIFPALLREMKYDGRIFALPTATVSYALFYNKKLFRQAGLDPQKPPRTWNEVKEYSKRLLKKDRDGHITQMGFIFYLGRKLTASQQTNEPALLMAWEKGVSFINKRGDKINLVNKEMIEIIKWILEAQKDYSLNDLLSFTAGFGYGDQHAFISEKVAMMVLGCNFPDNIARYAPDLDYGVAIIPTFEGCPTASPSGSWWMGIPRGAKNAQAAWQFIKYATDKNVQLKSIKAMDESLFPANRLAANDPSFLTSKANKIFLKEIEFAHSQSIVPLAHDVFWREFYSALERIMFGKQSPAASLGQAQQIIQQELNQAINYDHYVREHIHFPGAG